MFQMFEFYFDRKLAKKSLIGYLVWRVVVMFRLVEEQVLLQFLED